MNFEEFENQARLYVVGALDEQEKEVFNVARKDLGARAEAYIQECRRLNAAFALSLRPQSPRVDAKARLMALIQESRQRKNEPRKAGDEREQ